VSAAQLISGVFYISTYEGVRHILKEKDFISDSRLRGMVGGGCASLVGQSIVVPFDVISQHIMILGQAKGVVNIIYTKTYLKFVIFVLRC